jgi:hypothetical protein
MTAIELKEHILKTNSTKYILESIGCHKIVDHPNVDANKSTITCAQPDGDNPAGVVIKLCIQKKSNKKLKDWNLFQ